MKKIFKALFVLVAILVVVLFSLGFYAALPKKLATPQKWSEEASAIGTVSRVNAKGIEIRFLEPERIKGKKGFFSGEIGYTNGQVVRVNTTVYYERSYDIGFGAVQWVHCSVIPFTEEHLPQ